MYSGHCDEVGCHSAVENAVNYGDPVGDRVRLLCGEHTWTESFDWLMDTEMACPECGSSPTEVSPVSKGELAYATCELGHIYVLEAKDETN